MAVRPAARRPVVTGNGVAIAGAIVALAILGLSGIVLAWDGAWWVTHTGETGTPTFLHGRVGGWVTQAPALVVRWLGGDARALTIAFGLGFAAVSLFALVASWRIVRPDRDALLVFPLLGIGVALLPGQALMISEAVMAAALAWPLVLAAALGRVGRHRWLVGATVALLATLHPFAIPILLIGAAISGLGAWRTTDARERATAGRFALLLVVVAVLLAGRYVLGATSYEEDATSLDRLVQQFRGSVAGRPLVAVAGATFLGAWLVWRPKRDALGVVVVGLVVRPVADRRELDVQRVVPERRAELADHPRHVVVLQQRHVRLELEVEALAPRLEQVRAMAPAERRADDAMALLRRGDGDPDEVGEVARARAA